MAAFAVVESHSRAKEESAGRLLGECSTKRQSTDEFVDSEYFFRRDVVEDLVGGLPFAEERLS